MSTVPASDLEKLKNYTACDIADALLKLQHPDPAQQNLAGFLVDLVPRRSAHTSTNEPRIYVGPAFTVAFTAKSPPADSPEAKKSRPIEAKMSNIPAGTVWSDLAEPGSVVVVQQPAGQRNAVIGGIHMLRLKQLGVRALVVDGRVRDQREMAEMEFQVGR